MQHWRDVTEREFPDRPDLVELIPHPDEIDVCKLGMGGVINTDTCNAARETRRLLVEHVGGVTYEQDCCQHLRNVWINGVAKAVYSFVGDMLEDSLDNISSFLRISPDLSQLIRAFHKEFSLTANYPKGHGEHFRTWMIDKHPKEFLMHAERALGNRQDLVCMGAGPIYWNRQFCVDFLDERLAMKDGDNILQTNLHCLLTSVEMIAVTRFFSILHVGMMMPFRWLAGNTHKLAVYNWGPRSMGHAMDIIHSSCSEILDDVQLIHDKSYMMNLFSEIAEEIPEFKHYLTYEFEQKKTHFVEKSQSRAVPLKMLVNELFFPADSDNKNSDATLEKVAAVGIQALKDELETKKKATYKYLSISGSEFSYEHCPEEVKKAMLGTMATNDLAESSFAGVTAQIQAFGRIGLNSAAAISDARRNKFLHRPTTKKAIENNEKGLFHKLPQELRYTAIMSAMEMAPETRQSNTDGIDRQRAMQEKKVKLAKEEGLQNAKDEYIERLIYHSMWGSDGCWTTVSEVTAGLKNLKYKKDKYEALKNNIEIIHKGFGCQWSRDGKKLSIPELSKRLKDLIMK